MRARDAIMVAEHQIRNASARRRVKRRVQHHEGIRIKHRTGHNEHQMITAPQSVSVQIAQNIKM